MRKEYLYIIFFLALSFACNFVWAQEGGYMTIRGKVVLNEKGLQGVKVVLTKDGSKVDEALTGSSGKYLFNELTITPEGDTYIISISKPGHISVKHWVSTKAPDDRKTIFPDYFPTVELFKMVKEVKKEKALSAILDKPISKFGYSMSKGDFADDRAYFSTITARVNQLFEILDAEDRERERLLAAYRLKQLEEKNKADQEAEKKDVKTDFEIKYEEAVAKADEAYDKKKYRTAMSQYKEVLTLVAKSKLPKTQRDKLKKGPKRRLHDLETVMAELSDEEIDNLENGITEEVTSVEEVAEEIAEEVIEEETVEEEEVAEVEEEEVVEEITEEEQAKAEAENSIPNALEELVQMTEEKKEEAAQKRQEHKEIAAIKTMSSNSEVKEHEVAVSKAKKESTAKTNKNKDVVAQRNKAMLTMIANAKANNASEVKKASPSGETEIRPKAPTSVVMASTTAADKDKKRLDRTVVIVHNRIKVTATNKKSSQTSKTPAKAKVQSFKPKSLQYVEDSYYKTVTNTIITYPIKQDTLQQVDYKWGTSYYYKNAKEIDEATYNKVIEGLK